jgi:FkbM family methyltransferase
MQDDPRPETRLSRFLEYFSMLGFAFRHGKTLPSMAKLYYLPQLKRGLVYRRLARYAPEKIHRITFRAGRESIWDVHVRDNGQDAQMLVEFFKYNIWARLKGLGPEPKVIYDLGANIGISSLFLATLCPKARIYGFEPMPANYELCVRNLSNLTNAQVFNCAVGASSGTMSFEITDDPRAGHLAGSRSLESLHSSSRIEVAVCSVADLVEVKGLVPPDFLKVDVEGAELDVLNGLGVYAKGINQMHIETHSTKLHQECARWLQLNGFGVVEEIHYSEDLGGFLARK